MISNVFRGKENLHYLHFKEDQMKNIYSTSSENKFIKK